MSAGNVGKTAALGVLGAVLLLPALRALEFPVYLWRLSFASYQMSDWQRLLYGRKRGYELLAYVKQRTPEEALFLVLRMAEFGYYADRRFIRDIDPRMIPVYRSADEAQAHERLRTLGVDYVYVPWYHEPTLSNSPLQSVLADPALARLVKEAGDFRLYALRATPGHVPVERAVRRDRAFAPPAVEGAGPIGWHVVPNGVPTALAPWRLVAQPDGGKALRVDGEPGDAVTVSSWTSDIDAEAAFLFRAGLSGRGYVRCQIVQYMDPQSFAGDYGRSFLLWEGVLDGRARELAAQFLTYTGTETYQVRFELVGAGALEIHSVEIDRIALDTPRPREPLWTPEDLFGAPRSWLWR